MLLTQNNQVAQENVNIAVPLYRIIELFAERVCSVVCPRHPKILALKCQELKPFPTCTVANVIVFVVLVVYPAICYDMSVCCVSVHYMKYSHLCRTIEYNLI